MSTMRSTIATTAGLTLLGAGLAVPAQAAAPDACEDAGSSCSIVSRADVDGDGIRDSVSQVTWGKQENGTVRVTTRVATADGEKMYVVTELDQAQRGYYGAARVDGEDGYEIVIRTAVGAHTAYHQVLTYRDGRLTSLKDPRNRYRWITDSSVWSAMGYQKTTTATGAYKFVSRDAVDNDRDGDFTMVTTAVGWNASDRTWKRMGQSTRYDVAAATANRYSWWHVPYLPRGI